MTDTTDTPIRRAGSAIGEMLVSARTGTVDDLARAALTAALKVRWEESRDCFSKQIDHSEDAVIGTHLCVGTVTHWLHPGVGVRPYRAWISTSGGDDGQELGWFDAMAEAKTAVERAVIEAILGEGL